MRCKFLQHIGPDICKRKIESCDPLTKKNDQTIVRFSRRKDRKQLIRVNMDLKDLNLTNLDIPKETRLSINDSLCPYYRRLWNECKKLWNNKKSSGFLLLTGQFY